MSTLRALMVFVLVAYASAAVATAQVPDFIVLDGQKERLHTNPLAAYLADHPGVLPKSDSMSTANWRGYVATWQVVDDRLLLDKVEVRFSNPDTSEDAPGTINRNVISSLFPEGGEIMATWYSGALVIPRGEIVNYVHMGYASTHERYTILKVRSGQITERLDLDAEGFEAYKRAQFKAYKRTADYAALVRELKAGDPDLTAGQAANFLFDYASAQYLAKDYGVTRSPAQ